MYQFFTSRYNVTWDEITRFSPIHRHNATAEPTWKRGSSLVTFRPNTDPWQFREMFIHIGIIRQIKNPRPKPKQIR